MIFWQAGTILFLIEIFAFFFTITKIGFLKTFLLWAFSAVAGLWLVQSQGLSSLFKMNEAFNGKQAPPPSLFDAICVLISGVLFIFPGIISDFLALALLLPMTRQILKNYLKKKFNWAEYSATTRTDETIIEGTYTKVEEEVVRIDPPSPPRGAE